MRRGVPPEPRLCDADCGPADQLPALLADLIRFAKSSSSPSTRRSAAPVGRAKAGGRLWKRSVFL